MFKFQKFPFSLGLRKIEAHINTLVQDGWIVLGFEHIPASDGPGIFVFGLMKDPTVDEADVITSDARQSVNEHIAEGDNEPIDDHAVNGSRAKVLDAGEVTVTSEQPS